MKIKYIAILIFFCPAFVAAQSSIVPEDDAMLQAMQDEIHRGISDLKLPDYEKPFFILYNISAYNNYALSASLGSIIQESSYRSVLKNSGRVLVGDYSFNDESLEDNHTSQRTPRSISLPQDSSDYMGIRRALWSTTDGTYRDAAKSFSDHQQTLKQEGKELKDIPHRTFAKSKPITLIGTLTPAVIDKNKWKAVLINLSKKLTSEPAVFNSRVSLFYSEGYTYIASSEGTVARIPQTLAALNITAQGKNSKGELFAVQRSYFGLSLDKLPEEKELLKDAGSMTSSMSVLGTTAKLEETYNGPVLFLGQSVAETLSTTLFGSEESLMRNDNIEKLSGIQYNEDKNSLDSKIGKSVINESITVKTKPDLKIFEGVELLGYSPMDREGMVPQQVSLIEGGVLKNLLNNRTLTETDQQANGYYSRPGVVEVTIAQKNTEKELRDKLIAEAKKEGLDFAMIIRDAATYGVYTAYKVSVADGKEEFVRNVRLTALTMKSFRKMLGASGRYRAYNITNDNRLEGVSGAGITSFIVPDGLLIGNAELEPFKMPTLKEEEYVSRPQ